MTKKILKSKHADDLRRRAEKRIPETLENIKGMSAAEIQKLVHELNVHQIELEMQNEALRGSQAETAESQYKYTDLYDFAPIGYFTLDKKGHIIEANVTGASLLGAEKRSLAKQPFQRFIAPGYFSIFQSQLKNVHETQSKQICELKLKGKDGSLFDALIDTIAVIDGAGKFDHYRSAVTDITEITKAEALRESEIKYRGLYESTRDGMVMTDTEGHILECNRAYLDMLGYTEEEIRNLTSRQITPAKWHDLEKDIIKNKVLRTGYSDIYEKEYIRKDGTVFPVFMRMWAIKDEAGNVTGMWGIVSDITGRKHIEESLQRAHDELERRVEERTVELRTALSEIITLKEQLEAENIYFRHESKMKRQFEHIIGQSDGLKYVLYRAEQVAPLNTTVLILGETGTGKELIAFAIHDMSPRKERSLITVNCAALPGNLIESELFGREKGAFTGADTRQIGRFEVAHNSTLCLDEIGELPLEVQAKLLRVIQHNEFERLGSSHTVKVDVRIIATTNRDLEEEVRKGRFRQDLYYRLNVFPITVPPLRQRKEDIPLMVQAFMERYSRKLGKQITSIRNETMKELQDYPWPGNVRELESIIERAVILCPGPGLQLADKLEISSPPLLSAVRTLEDTERNQILKILSEARWRIEGKDGAAAILGLHPSTLRARMYKLGIVRPETKESN
jgi:PAS domain S-box-containing protein